MSPLLPWNHRHLEFNRRCIRASSIESQSGISSRLIHGGYECVKDAMMDMTDDSAIVEVVHANPALKGSCREANLNEHVKNFSRVLS